MAGPNTTITFSGPLTSGDTITLSWTGASGSVVSAVETAVPLRATNFQFDVGIDANTQASSYAAALFVDYGGNFNVSYISGTNYLIVNSKNTSNPVSGSSTSSNVTFFPNYSGGSSTGSTATITREDIRCRSSYLNINTYTGTSDSTLFTIKQYNGEYTGYTNARTSYSITKQKMISTQNNVWINPSNLVKEDLEGNITGYTSADYTVAKETGLNESKWVYISNQSMYLTVPVDETAKVLYVTDGFINVDEQQGLPNVMVTGNKRYIHRAAFDRIHFKTQDLTGVTYVTSTNPSATTVIYSGNLTTNTGYVKSLKIDNTNVADEWVKYTFNYSGQTPQDVTYYFYDECKYEPYSLVFKNKYGFLETLSLSKKTSKTLNTTNSQYRRSIVDIEGNVSLSNHSTKQFNVTGYEEWTMNTELLPEYMNDVMREMMLSEELWLIDGNGSIIPVIKLDEALSYKTGLNDKMIQYTIRLRLSHDTIKYFV